MLIRVGRTPAGHATADEHQHDIGRHQTRPHTGRQAEEGHPAGDVDQRPHDIHHHDRDQQQPQAVAEEAQQRDCAKLQHGNVDPRLARPDPVGPGAHRRRRHQVQQRDRRQIAHRVGAIAHRRAGQVKAQPQPDRQEDAEAKPLNGAGQQHFRMLPDDRKDRQDESDIIVLRRVLIGLFPLIHDPRQHEGDRRHDGRGNEVNRPPAEMLADPTRSDPRQKDAADHAGGQRCCHLPQPLRGNAF